MFTNPPLEQRSGAADALGCETEYMEMMRARVISIAPGTFETTVKGVFAAGDAGRMMQSLTNAASSGAAVGAFVTHELAAGDIEAELSSLSKRL